MKAVTLREIKKELNTLSTQEIQDLCLRLSRFKKENKELLTYLLFESHNESGYIESVKGYMDVEFEVINTDSYFYMRKSMRKILRNVKKFVRYSLKKETEVELLLYFCEKLKHFKPSISRSVQLQNMYNRQLLLAKKIISGLHEDLQYDYNLMLEDL
jgi:DNA repair photolyase